MELSDDAKQELAEVARILREDGVHIHKSYSAFLKSQTTKDEPTDSKPTEGGPPPPKEDKTDDAPPPKKSLWWGAR